MKHLTWINQTLYGRSLQQTWSALFMLDSVLTTCHIKWIVELGTGSGALYEFFSQYAPTITFDLENVGNLWPVYNLDVFSASAQRIIDNFVFVKDKVLIFCDDGDKPRELKTYLSLLKRGDHIMVHDWKRSDGIWPKDLEGITGFEEYRQDEFDELKTYILSLRKL